MVGFSVKEPIIVNNKQEFKEELKKFSVKNESKIIRRNYEERPFTQNQEKLSKSRKGYVSERIR